MQFLYIFLFASLIQISSAAPIKINEKHLNSVSPDNYLQNITLKYKLHSELKFIKDNEKLDEFGFLHITYHQEYQGVNLFNSSLKLHINTKGELNSANGEIFSNLNSSTIALSKEEAFSKAVKQYNSTNLIWPSLESYNNKIKQKPLATGELVYIDKFYRSVKKANALVLAYKFDVYVKKPRKRTIAYINAETGALIYSENKLCNINGTLETFYSGNQQVKVSDVTLSGSYNLLNIEDLASGIHTDIQDENYIYTEVLSFDNIFTKAEFSNDVLTIGAFDAHWGAEQTYNYFKTNFNRNSIDDLGMGINSSMLNSLEDNAYWDGASMTYMLNDDGSKPYSSMDVCGHELAHGICQYSCNLDYYGESGGINEAFSDMWGASVRHYTRPNDYPWLIGDLIGNSNSPFNYFRSMNNPSVDRYSPDTYHGKLWNDELDVHQLSGIGNKFFYILTNGENALNDFNEVYNCTGLGFNKSARIIYNAETNYLSSTSQYSDFKDAILLAATNIYGANSFEYNQTYQALLGVGLINIHPQTALHTVMYPGALHITSVGIDNQARTSGKSFGGRDTTNFTFYKPFNVPFNIAVEQQNYFSYFTPPLDEAVDWNVFLDINNDGQINYSTEFVGSSNLSYNTSETIQLNLSTYNIPDQASRLLRVIVIASMTSPIRETVDYAAFENGGVFYGEIEDYTIVNSATVGINETLSQSNINISPNPSSGVFKINGINADIPTQIEVTNNLGQIVYTTNNSLGINLTHLSKGLYQIKISQNETSSIKKLVLE